MRPTEQRLRDDERGAIVLMAVFMAAFLCGGLWYIMGIGDAALHKQSMQSAADSTAYIGAVYHARGMNIIAMVNLVMGAVVAIAAAAKVLQMIAVIVKLAAYTMCALSKQGKTTVTNPDGTVTVTDYSSFGWTCDVAKEADKLWTKMSIVIANVDAQTEELLTGLSEAQKEVARTTPWVASSFSAKAATEYKLVAGGAAGSVSMWPNGERYGLPVQDAPFQKICSRGGIFAGLIVQSTLPAAFDKLVSKMVGGMIQMIPKDLCQGKYAGGDQWDFFDEDDVCEDKWKKEEKDKCKEDLEKDKKPVPKIDLTNYADEDKKSAKEPYLPAENGNDYFQVYGTVVAGDDAFVKRSDKGVDIAAWGKAKAGGKYGALQEQIGVAQAEFYYDQTAAAVTEDTCFVPPCGMNWNSYREEALWNLRWRARLRRVRMPVSSEVNILGSGVPDLGFDKYDSEALDTFNNFAGSGTALKMVSSSQIASQNGASGFLGGGTELIH